jgi:hypothetical protein
LLTDACVVEKFDLAARVSYEPSILQPGLRHGRRALLHIQYVRQKRLRRAKMDAEAFMVRTCRRPGHDDRAVYELPTGTKADYFEVPVGAMLGVLELPP